MIAIISVKNKAAHEQGGLILSDLASKTITLP